MSVVDHGEIRVEWFFFPKQTSFPCSVLLYIYCSLVKSLLDIYFVHTFFNESALCILTFTRQFY